jgi:DNA replication protein DnaC
MLDTVLSTAKETFMTKAKRSVAADVVLLKHHLGALRLPSIKAECEQVARQAAADNLDYLAFLLRLCERELLDREARACSRRLKAARLGQIKSLDDFDFTAQPSLNRPLILELARCEFISRRESVILLGGPGTGKTHVAVGLAVAACQRGKKVRFFRVSELMTQLVEAREERVLGRLRTALGRLDLLVLDEFGYVPASQVGAELLFDVISTAYERSSVIVTTNLPFEEWKEVLGSERRTGATLDGLTHRCTIVGTGKESYRLREAGKRRRGPAPGLPPSTVDDGPTDG